MLGFSVQLVAACSLVFPSSDFLGSDPGTGGGGASVSTSSSSGGSGGVGGGMGGAPPGAVARVFIAFGDRDRPPGAPMSFDTDLNDISYADLDQNGRLSSWQVTTPAPFTGSFNIAVVDGVFVAFGRVEQIDNFDRPSALFSAVVPNGLAGDWTVSSDPTTLNTDSSTPSYRGGGAGYILGGSVTVDASTSELTDTYYLPVDAAARTVSARVQSSDLITARYRFGTLIHSGRMYVAGGYDGSNFDLVESAPINADGSLGPFLSEPALVDDRAAAYRVYYPAMCASETHIYLVGGSLSSSARSDIVLFAELGASGEILAWQAGTKLPSPVTLSSCFVHDGTLYSLGGEGATERTARVISSPLGADGANGTWAELDPPLPFGRSDMALTVVPFE